MSFRWLIEKLMLADKWNICRLISSMEVKATQNSSVTSSTTSYGKSKTVWVWTESKQVMTAAVERGWNTFVFRCQKLADDWSCKSIQTFTVCIVLGFCSNFEILIKVKTFYVELGLCLL